jgi:4-hydroxy-tetrahydrodipicolinate synthase
MSDVKKKLKGILPAPITPFDADGNVLFDSFEKQIRYLVDAGVHGFFVAGTTAEGALLTSEERCKLFELMRDHTTDDHLRCVVVIRPDTNDVVRGIDDIAALNPDYISAVTPYYLGVSQSEIVGHYTRIADHSPVPMILYNIPQNTHNPMTLATVFELAQHPNIVGIKDSSGDFGQFQRGFLTTDSSDFTWIQGEDLLDAASFLLGAECIVTGMSNAWAEPYVAMYRAATQGDLDAVVSEQRRINELARIIEQTDGRTIQAIKAAASMQGRTTLHMRVPSMDLESAGRDLVASVVQELGLV